MVKAAIRAGSVDLDGEAFSKILQAVPAGRVEKEVREQQAKELADLARRSNAALAELERRSLVELQRQAEELKRRAREEAPFQAAHRDLHDAVVEQQLAKARAEALAKVEEFLRRSKKG